jgi:glucose uptake protein GlcU
MMYKNQQIHLFVGIFALSAILVIGPQYQQYSFGQANEASSSTEQTFRSGFDTFVISEPGLIPLVFYPCC